MKKLVIAIFAVAMAAPQWGIAQLLNAGPQESTIAIRGTSSLHDWESEVTEFSLVTEQSDNQFTNLDGVLKVKSIKSGKSIMDDKTYEALGAGQFPEIRLSGDQLALVNGKVTGQVSLTIKGVTQVFDINANSTLVAGNIRVSGELPLDMTAFGIEPPTAMFGTLETGKDVTITYNITLLQK